MFCNKCKNQIADDSIVCRFCGEKVSDDPNKYGYGGSSAQNEEMYGEAYSYENEQAYSNQQYGEQDPYVNQDSYNTQNTYNNQQMYPQDYYYADYEGRGYEKPKRKSKAPIIIIAIICLLVIGIGVCFAAMSQFWTSDDVINNHEEQEESVKDKDKEKKEEEEEEDAAAEEEEEEAEEEPILEEKYACLLTVPDPTGCADMIMLAVINTENEKINLLSIPRDTIVDGGNEKISEIALYRGNQDMDDLTDAVEDLTGIKIDSYVQVDIECVKDTVDLFGGVEFYVPQRMNYSDPYQDLTIDLQRGMQTLNGEQAQQLLRFRTYSTGDIRRTQTQREFVVEAFKQHAKIENI